MADSRELYNILGIEKDAAEADIKRAYRKAALRWHPDKNLDNKEQADIMFKKIAEAYATLSNPTKRALYDKGGTDAVNGGEGDENPEDDELDPMNVFEQFFEGCDPFAEFDRMFDDDFFSSGFGGVGCGDSGFGKGCFGDDDLCQDLRGERGHETTGHARPHVLRSRSPRRRVRKKGAWS